MIKHSVALGGTLILIAIAGPLIWSRYIREDFVISVTAFAIGIVSFFGIANMRPSASGPVVLRGETLRTAIACSLITSYLFIVCFTTFVKTSQSVGGVTEEFVKSFSNIVG